MILRKIHQLPKTVNLLLEYAIKIQRFRHSYLNRAKINVQVRYRIDGVLKEVNKLPRNVHGALVSRIKILSNLKITNAVCPQDGSI